MKYGKNFQDIISSLNEYWKKQGCILVQPYDMEKGAGTFQPRHRAGRADQNTRPTALMWSRAAAPPTAATAKIPTAWANITSTQVIMKPAPANIQEIYLNSLKAIGLDPKEHDVRFIEDDWQSPTLGALRRRAGKSGWDGMEITQFTYFQNMAGYALNPITRGNHLRAGTHCHVPARKWTMSLTSAGTTPSPTARCTRKGSGSFRTII